MTIVTIMNRDVNQSAEEYFINGYGETASSSSSSSSSGDKIMATFNKYKDSGSGNIEVEGMQKFFEDAGIRDPSDIVTILISSKMNAQNMGAYTQQEFRTGFQAMGVNTAEDLKRKIP
jgi:DCN1-like protein 1/2